MRNKCKIFNITIFLLLCCSVSFAQTKQSTIFDGQGPIFLKKIIAILSQSYSNEVTPIKIKYVDSSCSKTFLAAIEEATDFGLLAYPLSPEQVEQKRILQLPFMMYGVVPVVQLKNVKSGQLILNKQILRDVFLQKIKYWDDPIISHLNPNVVLPHQLIIVIKHPYDSSLSKMTRDYLGLSEHDVSSNDADKVLSSLITMVSHSEGALILLPYNVAFNSRLTWTKLINQSGVVVQPAPQNFQAALLYAEQKKYDFKRPYIDVAGDTSWPITGNIYVIMHRNNLLKKRVKTLLDFIKWSYHHGQISALFEYTPMPQNIIPEVLKNFNAQAVISTAQTFPLRSLFPSVKPMTIDQLYKLYKDNKVVLIDVRSAPEFNIIHIQHTKHIPLSSPDFRSFIKQISQKNTGKPIVLYCNGTTCAKSYRGVEMAMKDGVRNIYVYDGGVMEWVLAHPENTFLIDQVPANLNELISKQAFDAKNLSYDQFKAKQLASNGLIIDIRDEIQRHFKLTERHEVKHRLLTTEEVQWIPFDKLIIEFKAGKYKDRTLFLFDAVGKQVRWLQYYLRQYGYQNYWFLEGGVRAVLGEEKHF